MVTVHGKDEVSGPGSISIRDAARLPAHLGPITSRTIAMLGLLVSIPLLFAQAAPAPAPAPDPAPAAGSNNGLGSLLPFLGIPVIFYLIMVRPQQQQDRKRREMIDALKKNDKVLTVGGIYGTVISVDTERARVVLRVDDERGVKLAFSKASIQQVVESTPEKGSEPS